MNHCVILFLDVPWLAVYGLMFRRFYIGANCEDNASMGFSPIKYDVLNNISGDCFVVVVVGCVWGRGAPTRNEYYLHDVACHSKKKSKQPEDFDQCTRSYFCCWSARKLNTLFPPIKQVILLSFFCFACFVKRAWFRGIQKCGCMIVFFWSKCYIVNSMHLLLGGNISS